MNYEEIKTKILQILPEVRLRIICESLLIENPSDILRVATLLKHSEIFRFDVLSSLTGVDYLDYLETVYHLYSTQKKPGSLTLRIRVKRENPRIPSLVPIYRGAELQEREAYDMYGIVYENHPDLRRLFMWEGFEGFPMRKDYDQEDSETLEVADIEWLERHDVQVPEEMRKKAEALKTQGKRAVAEKEGKEKA